MLELLFYVTKYALFLCVVLLCCMSCLFACVCCMIWDCLECHSSFFLSFAVDSCKVRCVGALFLSVAIVYCVWCVSVSCTLYFFLYCCIFSRCILISFPCVYFCEFLVWVLIYLLLLLLRGLDFYFRSIFSYYVLLHMLGVHLLICPFFPQE